MACNRLIIQLADRGLDFFVGNDYDLLIDFIFPESAEMTLEKFTADFGDIVLQGIDVFGEFKFIKNAGLNSNQAGIWVV